MTARHRRGPLTDAMLVMFARPPHPAAVARVGLAAELGAEAALALHRALLADSIELLHRASAGGIRRAVRLAEPWDPDADLAARLADVDLGTQQGGSLAERLLDCFSGLLAEGYRRVVIIADRSPTLPIERIEHAFALLRDRDTVLVPSESGGVCLIGARSVTPEIFRKVDWEGPRAVTEAAGLMKILGMPPAVLPGWYSLATGADLARLAQEIRALQAAGEPFPRATAALLESLHAPLTGA